MILTAIFVLAQVQAPTMPAPVPPNEAAYHAVDRLEAPDGAILEVGGLGFLSDGRLVASTRRGQVWIVENPLAKDPRDARFHLFCEGLQEGLGLSVDGDDVYVLQRAELSRLRDTDRDGRCDAIDTICDAWGVSGNYHEFAFGLPRDAQGNFYVSLNLGFTEPKWWHGRSLAPWRGWVVKIAPNGTLTPFASGFRSPCGIGTNALGDLFVTDNQGDWMPVCPLEHVREGRFYGAPASLVWTDAYLKTRTEPSLTNPVDAPRTPPACWIPYGWSRSTGDMRAAPRDGSFGPYEDQLILAELTNGLVLRADLEKVRGEYQGAVMIVRRDVGSAIRGLFAPDGTLFLGLTNRGWGGLAPGHGIARVRWTGRTPFEMRHVRLQQDGFAIELTEPLASGAAVSSGDVSITQYHYDWWWEYGSPERVDGVVPVARVDVSPDRRTLRIVAPVEAGHCARVIVRGLVSATGQTLLHDEFSYTINQLPEGPVCTTPIARVAPPPPPRENQSEGWLRLTHGDALDLWEGADTWQLVDAEVDTRDPSRFSIRAGNNALVDVGDAHSPLVSRVAFGDARLHMGFMLPAGGETEVLVHGRYGLVLRDDGAGALTTHSCGAAEPGPSSDPAAFPGAVPSARVFRGPGQWHELDLVFRAPVFDAQGVKVSNARFENVTVDGARIHERVEWTGVSAGRLDASPESARGPLVVRADRGTCAVGGVRIRPMPVARDASRATPLLGDDDTDGWIATEGTTWKRDEGELTSGGVRGWLVTRRDDWRDVHVHARCRLGSGAQSALWLRARLVDGGMTGIAVALNADHPDPERTGSVRVVSRDAATIVSQRAPRTVGLVGEGTWFDLDVRVADDADGATTVVTVDVNGVTVQTARVTGMHGLAGALALEQHHEGSLVQFGTIETVTSDAR